MATKQTITGEKTFSSLLNTAAIKASGEIATPSLAASDYVTIAGIKLRKLEDGALMLEGNLALTGALTMYASNGQSFDTIYDGLPIDNDTIYWQEVDGSRVLKAREGSGSSFDKSAMWNALAGSTTEQINKSHLTTALTGYATESWVSGKNYAVKATTLAGYGITDGVNDVSVTGTGNAVTAASISGHTLILTKGSTFSLSGHKHAWADITSGKPSTLSGYGITDAYTKTESDGRYPTKTGSGASGTWKINVTGNAGTATKLQTARSLWGNNFDGTANISGDITLAIGKGIYLSANEERWLLQTKRSDNTQINGIKTNGSQMCTYFGDTKTMQFGLDKIYSYVDFRAEKDLYINGIRLHKTSDGVITLEGNLAVTGGVTMYAIDPVSVSTVMDGVVVDGTTIKKENGKLVAVGGGEAGNVSWDNISGKPSVFPTNIANITDLHSSWDSVLAAQKPAWLTAVSIATISDLHANWDALLKAAPSAYVTRWPTISEVTNKQNLIVKLNGGTTEGTNQFTYNATGAKTINITPAGIGAAASSHNHSWSNITSGKPTTLAGYGITDAPTKTGSGASGTWGISISGTASNADKLDNYHETDFFRARDYISYSILENFASRKSGTYNVGYDGYSGLLTVFYFGAGSTSAMEILAPYYDPSSGLQLRYAVDNNRFTSWRSFAFEDGNIASATKLQTERKIWGVGFNGTNDVVGNITLGDYDIIGHGGARIIQNMSSGDLCLNPNKNVGIGKTSTTYKLDVEGSIFSSNGFVTTNNTILSKIGYTHTEILSWYWDSTYGDHVKISIPGINDQSKYIIIAASTGLVVSGNISIGNSDIIGYGNARIIQNLSGNLGINPNGNVGIGTTDPRAKLHVNGDILSTGGSSFYGSDKRAKTITGLVNLSLKQICEAPTIRFRWNGWHIKDDGRNHIGGIAQYINDILPECVIGQKYNFLSMDYATVAYTFAVHTARHLLTYESRTDKKIKKLEREIVILKKQLKKLGYEEVRTLDDQSV